MQEIYRCSNHNFYTKLPGKPNMLQILPIQEEILLHLADHLSTMAIYAAEKQAGISVPESSVWKSASVSDIVSPGYFPAYTAPDEAVLHGLPFPFCHIHGMPGTLFRQ